MRAVSLGTWLVFALSVLPQEPKSLELTPEEQKLSAEAAKYHSEGMQLYRQGRMEEAIAKFQQALEIRRKVYPASKYPAGHADLAASLNNIAALFHAAGRPDEARPYYEQALAMHRARYPAEKYPVGHPDLAASLNNLGFLLQSTGNAEQARPYLEQALAMYRKLYPKESYPAGHASLSACLSNLGGLCREAGNLELARSYFEQALAMDRELYPASKYPNGHPDLAGSLNNMGLVLFATKDMESSCRCLEQALAMRRALFQKEKYPAGHPQLARSLSNLGMALKANGDVALARKPYDEALAMRRALYPKEKYPAGHPAVMESLINLAGLFQDAGAPEQAVPYFKEALAIQGSQADRYLNTASEAEALSFLQAQPLARDGYLSVTAGLSETDEDVYCAVWRTRALVSRLLEQRRAAARVVGTDQAARLDSLRRNRRQTEEAMLSPRLEPAVRDKRLTQLADERSELERELAAAIPTWKRRQELDKLGPADLIQSLPAGAVFVDLIAYTRFELREGQEKRIPGYAAFVLRASPAGGPAIGANKCRRIDLPEAEVIDALVRRWREAIEARQDTSEVAAELSHRLWEPINKQLPPGTKTLYLAADGDLARVPWAALSTGKDRVLLEDCMVALVPHGAFLLEQLRFPRRHEGAGTALALGQVAYNSKIWPNLAGTDLELKSLAYRSPTELRGVQATSARLLAELPKARYAHLATHGFFNSEALTAEKKREAEARKNHQFGDETRFVAAKNPLGYVGLVLANGEILSGLRIVDLPLEDTTLVTLSACETGLGDLTAGKGVENLQMAFHLAGCENVIASLWKVNDAATAALTAKFYHELWINKKPPIEALREAQLTIYYHPELIPELAGERGAPKLKEAVAVKSDPVARAPGSKRADTKLWAAFVLSGVGK